jgi:hypothetical protein
MVKVTKTPMNMKAATNSTQSSGLESGPIQTSCIRAVKQSSNSERTAQARGMQDAGCSRRCSGNKTAHSAPILT